MAISGRLLLLGAMAAAVQAQVLVTPRSSTLLEGGRRTFQAQLAEGTPAGGWSWSILEGGVGAIDPCTGTYQAPGVSQPCLVKVRATARSGPGFTGEASLLVLPFQPFDTVEKVLGPGWLAPFSSELPFLNPATGQRFHEKDTVLASPPCWQTFLRTHYAGYDIPFRLTWAPWSRAEGQLLSFQEKGEVLHRDVSGMNFLEVTLRACPWRVTLEALRRSSGLAGAWDSRTEELRIHLRGMLPYAGNPFQEAGDRDGPICAASFREPFGLAAIAEGRGNGYGNPGGCLVTDPQSHVIRKVSVSGEVSTPWGQPGVAGHRDQEESRLRRFLKLVGGDCLRTGGEEPSLFNRPTFLEVGPRDLLKRNPTWIHCMVADSGNHVIRKIRPDGSCATHAGVPGQAGFRDSSWGQQALFNNPQGLAEDFSDNLYVADQGNHVIRCISPAGRVRTLAGSPGQPGDQDGTGSEARFKALRGLVLFGSAAHPYALYAVDGHAIRRISLAGAVTTVLGVVEIPGFLDIPGGDAAPLQPCLRDPCGICATATGLAIADQGNNSVRSWSVGDRSLHTLVGDPDLPETRWGLPRDGLKWPLDERYAAVAAPRTLMANWTHPDRIVVSTGSCLAQIAHTLEIRDTPELVILDDFSATLAEACVCRFLVATRNIQGALTDHAVHYSVDFLDPGGALAERRTGVAASSTPISVQGVFSRRGTGTVVVRCVTDQGASVGAQKKGEVR